VKGRGELAALLGLGLGLLAGCSEQDAAPIPLCGSDVVALVAESVPGASLVPCLTEVPAGWSNSGVLVGDAGTKVELNSDRAGDNAAVLEFRASCEVDQAVPLPDRVDGVDRYERLQEVSPSFRSDRYLVFDGGCVRWRFHFSPGSPASLSVELSVALQLVNRPDFDAILSGETGEAGGSGETGEARETAWEW